MDLAQSLGYNYVFRGLQPNTVQYLANLAVIKEFQGGDVIVRQFDRDNDLIIILEGEALIKSFHGDVMAECGPGSIVGEVSLIDEEPRSATVVARKYAQAAILNGSQVRELMEADPRSAAIILGNICRVLCRRLRTMNVQVDAITNPR